MVFYIIIAVLSILGTLGRQTYLRYAAADGASGQPPARVSTKGYRRWLAGKLRAFFAKDTYRKANAVLGAWTREHYPGWMKWIFIGFAASLAYLAVSGVFFAVFIRRGMFGYPLLLHVVAGGVFALSLAAVLLWRGRAYRFDKDEAAVFEAFACPIFKNLSKALMRKFLFWGFGFFGVVQVLTALGSMLPIFTYSAQQAMIVVHRYSALAVIVTAIMFIDLVFIPARRP